MKFSNKACLGVNYYLWGSSTISLIPFRFEQAQIHAVLLSPAAHVTWLSNIEIGFINCIILFWISCCNPLVHLLAKWS